jgi:hypothetical protein
MGKHSVWLVKIVCVLAVVCWLPATGSLGHWATAWGAVPHLVRYQGQAVDAQGIPLQGPYTLTFRLYDADTAGALVWQEVQANVPINKGHFSVLLGSVTSLNVDWNLTLWLSVQVGSDPELLPRQRITSVPLAIRAEVADTAKQAEQLTVPVTTSTITDDANKLVPSGAIILWDGTTCPTGYTRVSSLDGALVKVGPIYAAPFAAGAVELAAHTHAGPNHTHTQTAHLHTMNVRLAGQTTVWNTTDTPMASSTEFGGASGGGNQTGASGTGPTGSTGSGMTTQLLACKKN